MKKMTYLFLLAATLGACSPKPENKIETPPKHQPLSFPKEMPSRAAISTERHTSNG